MFLCCQECQSYEERLDCLGLTNDVVGAVTSVRQVKFIEPTGKPVSLQLVNTRVQRLLHGFLDMSLDHGERGMSYKLGSTHLPGPGLAYLVL